MQTNIICYCVTILLFLSDNELLLNDQINFYVINACIFLFSTMILMACWFPLYILGLDDIISDCFHCIREIIKCYINIQFIVSIVLLMFIEDTIYLNIVSPQNKHILFLCNSVIVSQIQ